MADTILQARVWVSSIWTWVCLTEKHVFPRYLVLYKKHPKRRRLEATIILRTLSSMGLEVGWTHLGGSHSGSFMRFQSEQLGLEWPWKHPYWQAWHLTLGLSVGIPSIWFLPLAWASLQYETGSKKRIPRGQASKSYITTSTPTQGWGNTDSTSRCKKYMWMASGERGLMAAIFKNVFLYNTFLAIFSDALESLSLSAWWSNWGRKLKWSV